MRRGRNTKADAFYKSSFKRSQGKVCADAEVGLRLGHCLKKASVVFLSPLNQGPNRYPLKNVLQKLDLFDG
jgi:hypothetical protein